MLDQIIDLEDWAGGTCGICGYSFVREDMRVSKTGGAFKCRLCDSARTRKWQIDNPQRHRDNVRRRVHRVRAGGPIPKDFILNSPRECYYCGVEMKHLDYGDQVSPMDPSYATVEHLRPISRGGDNSPDNLVSACRACNLKKSSKTEEEFKNYGP